MSISTGISRVTGFIRNWAMAYAIGATFFASSYVVANNIPNMIYELVAGGVLSAVFIPIFIERLRAHGEQDAGELASSVLNVSILALGIVAVIATVWAEPFVRTQTFTLSEAQVADAVYLFRFFAVQIVFYGAAAIFTGILNSHRHFVAPAAGPIFNNLVVIATLFAYVPLRYDPMLAKTVLGIGTTLGVVAQMAVQLPVLVRLRFRWLPRIDWHHPALRTLGGKMLPVIGYVTVNLIGLSVRNAYAFAAHTATPGQGPSVLQYAWLFYQLPYGVFAVALATAVFPELSESATRKDWPAFRGQFAKGVRINAALVIPAAAMLIGLATPLCGLYLSRGGAFTAADVPAVAGVLVVWAAGLFSFTSYMFTVKGFYANQDTRTPMFTNVFATLLQVGLYATLTVGVLGWPGIGLQGIPAADAISYSAHLLLLLFLLRRKVGGFDLRGIAWTTARVFAASVVGAGIAWGIVELTPSLSRGLSLLLVQVALAATVGLLASYGLMRLMRVREIEEAARMASRLAGRLMPWTEA